MTQRSLVHPDALIGFWGNCTARITCWLQGLTGHSKKARYAASPNVFLCPLLASLPGQQLLTHDTMIPGSFVLRQRRWEWTARTSYHTSYVCERERLKDGGKWKEARCACIGSWYEIKMQTNVNRPFKTVEDGEQNVPT